MKFSYNWIKTYFDKELPKPQELAELLTFHSFEVEEVIPEGKDHIFEIDILPNRRHDCLSHRGIAREISVLTGIPLSRDPFKETIPKWNKPKGLRVEVEDSEASARYMAAFIRGVSVSESPDWLKDRLSVVGQKSINNIVDATNYIMFELGQPLHAFDADTFKKKDGDFVIGVRDAKKKERIHTLDGEEYTLEKGDIVIVDGANDTPVGIAGVKGGANSEIKEQTKNIIIESANFNPALVRAVSERLKLRTDASLRFESGLATEQAGYALKEVILLIEKVSGGKLEGVHDVWGKKEELFVMPISVSDVNKALGTEMDVGVLKNILEELKFEYKEVAESILVTIPFERLDVREEEDLVEEIGRIYGYEKIDALPLPKTDSKPSVNKVFYYAEKIRDILTSLGFSEVYTHAIGEGGEVELENPLAEDKRFLRTSIENAQFSASIRLNVSNREYLGFETIKVFEIGKVFDKNGERWEFAIGSNSLDELDKATETLFKELGISQQTSGSSKDEQFVYFYDLEKDIISELPDPDAYEIYQKSETDPKYKPISHFPFALRDIAVFVPRETSSEDLLKVLKDKSGELLVQARLFDEFKKDDKISYAFRLVFQSQEKTLSDEEVNEIMEQITGVIHENEGWKVR